MIPGSFDAEASGLVELRSRSAKVAAALWLGVSVLLWWRPFSPEANRAFLSEIAFAVLAGTACGTAIARFSGARGRSPRWAYGSLAASFAIWVTIELVEVALGRPASPQFELTSDLFYLVAYSLVLVAAETVAAPSGPQRGAFHLQIELLATLLVIDALLCYFLLLPYNLDATNSLRSVSWWSYYALFDLLLLARLVPLALRAVPGPARRLVGWLAVMAVFLFGADFSETIWRATGHEGVSPSPLLELYYLALLAGAVAASVELRRVRGSGEHSLGSGLAVSPATFESALLLPRFSPVLAYVVALPLLHLVIESIEPAPASYRTARAVLVIAVTGILGSLAAWSWSSFRRHHLRVLEASDRATEALSRSRHLESVGRLAAGVAHDFNNRLTVILGFASRLRGRSGDAAAREQAAAAIAEAADQASRLTMELLAVGRVQAAAPIRLDLAEMGEELAAEARQLAGESVTVELRREATALPIQVDRMHLLRVVWNLAANASDAMPHGGPIELILGARRISSARDAAGEAIPAGDYALLAIADKGVGMTPEMVGRLFDPFFTTKEFGRGSGLGLAAALGLIRSNGGYVTVESEPGSGSRFEVLFPLLERTLPRVR